MKKQLVKFAVLSALVLIGCNRSDSSSQTTTDSSTSISMDMPPPSTVEMHDHPTEGPHHGSLIELGKEEFHAEIVHRFKSVSIYIFDSAVKNPVPIEASEVTINLLHDGKPEQFKLSAMPEASDPPGKSSRFVLNSQELARHIDDENTAPKLSVSINGKTYRGAVPTEHAGHDHSGHNH